MGDNRDLYFQSGAIPVSASSGCTPELTIPRRASRHVEQLNPGPDLEACVTHQRLPDTCTTLHPATANA